jgi:D-arginine dehydrogenase
MERTDAVVVGGGVAGLATAAALARAGAAVVLLEREPILASHSSGRNAAIWLPVQDDATMAWLARRSAELLEELLEEPWLQPCGALFVAADGAALTGPERGARRAGMRVTRLDAGEAAALAPTVAGGKTAEALWLAEAGVLDIHAMALGLARAARRSGAALRTKAAVARVATRGGRVEGVELAEGARIASDHVVVASGAWAACLGDAAGAPIPLQALRRHLVHLDGAERASGPVVWAAGDEMYYRAEPGGWLASPCDEAPWEPGEPPVDPAQLAVLARKLEAWAPPLAARRVRRSWACLRTFAPDRKLVAGADPRVEGLHWLAGMGGCGMTIGAAAGELAAACVLGRAHPQAEHVAPARLL